MSYNKDDVKEKIELDDIYNLLDYFDAEPQMFNNYIIARTIFILQSIIPSLNM